MHESKAVLLLLAILTALAAWMVWALKGSAWLQYGLPAVSVVSLALLLKMQLARNKVPDYLRKVAGRYFDREGFCFAVAPVAHEGICWLCIYFQNKYDRPCGAHVVLRPSLQFFLKRRDLPATSVWINCGPAAFGVAYVPWAIPTEFQGKRQRLDVGADVVFPEGRGRMLRFRDGKQVGPTDPKEQEGGGLAELVLGAVGIHIKLSLATSLRIKLPPGVADKIPEGVQVEVDELWKLGDENLDVRALRQSILSGMSGAAEKALQKPSQE